MGAVLSGARSAGPAEQASFGALSSFAITILAARATNYIRERRRETPALRSVVRRAVSRGQRRDRRIHHFVPGIGLAFAAGARAIFTHERGALLLSLPFGVGAALTLDELVTVHAPAVPDPGASAVSG